MIYSWDQVVFVSDTLWPFPWSVSRFDLIHNVPQQTNILVSVALLTVIVYTLYIYKLVWCCVQCKKPSCYPADIVEAAILLPSWYSCGGHFVTQPTVLWGPLWEEDVVIFNWPEIYLVICFRRDSDWVLSFGRGCCDQRSILHDPLTVNSGWSLSSCGHL